MKKIKKLIGEELIKGSIILFILMGIYNVFNYIFQMSMAKILGPSDYGILAVLMSIIYIFAIPNEAIQTISAKFSSSYNSKKGYGEMKDILVRGLKKGFLFSSCIFIIYSFLGIFISRYLKIDYSLIVFTGLFIIIVFTIPVVRGVLQGRKKFGYLGINLVIESLIKLIFSLALVFIGFGVFGSIVGVLMGGVVSFFVAFLSLKEVIKAKKKKVNFGNNWSQSISVFVAMTGIVLMYSLDIIFARRFFNPELAGIYAFVSLIAKTIIFVSIAIGKAMFPISNESYEKGDDTKKLLKKSFTLVLLISSVALLFYALFPKTIIYLISFGSEAYTSASGILFILGLAASFISFSNILLLYNLAVNKIKKPPYEIIFFVIIQIGLFYLFNNSLLSFSLAFLISSAMFFFYCLNIRD